MKTPYNETQMGMFGGGDERALPYKAIVENVVAAMPDNLPPEKRRSIIMWCSALQFPQFIEFLDAVSEFRKLGSGVDWVAMARTALLERIVMKDMPSFETLTRTLRLHDESNKDKPKDDGREYGGLAKTIR